MAYLRTLEGSRDTAGASVTLDDLFDTNDVLGCLLFGYAAWNQIKLYAANRALELLANKNDFFSNLRKIGGSKKYIRKNDILDKAFGFNDVLGCSLYGADEWGEFVRDVKASAYFAPPTLGSITGAIKSLIRPSGLAYPENLTPGGILQFTLMPGATNVADAWSALGSKGQSEKAANEKAQNYKKQADAANENAAKVQQQAEQLVAQAREDYNVAYADARSKADADAAANKQLQYELQTNPEYMQNKRNNILLICAAGLVGLAIVKK